MSNPTDPQWIQLIAVLVGAVIGSGLTAMFSWLSKKRQLKLDMWNIRMQTFSETAPLYNKIALHNAWNLSQQLDLPNNQRDIELMFYYLCNMLSLRKQIIDTIGDLQFADLTAERIIIELGIAIRRLVVDQFGQINTSRMTSLVNGDLPFGFMKS